MIRNFNDAIIEPNFKRALDLAWLSCPDFKALSAPENNRLLNNIWATKKRELSPYFQNQEVTLETIVSDFTKISLTHNHKLGFGYFAENNTLSFNILSFLFDQDNFLVLPSLPWKLAGQLLHEHYLFLNQEGMIGKSEKENDIFYEKNWAKAEKAAYL